MSTIQHAEIQSANCHEPKHVTDATTGDAGKVVTPSSSTAGTSVLRKLTLADLGISLDKLHAQIIGNTATDSITAASDATLHTGSDYDDITRFSSSTIRAGAFNPATGTYTVSESGRYRIQLSLSVSSSVVTSTFGIAYSVNGTYLSPDKYVPKATASAIGDIVQLHFIFEEDLSASDAIVFGIACDKTVTATVREACAFIDRIE